MLFWGGCRRYIWLVSFSHSWPQSGQIPLLCHVNISQKTWAEFKTLCWLMIIGDFTTQHIGDHNNPIGKSRYTNQYFMEWDFGIFFPQLTWLSAPFWELKQLPTCWSDVDLVCCHMSSGVGCLTSTVTACCCLKIYDRSPAEKGSIGIGGCLKVKPEIGWPRF